MSSGSSSSEISDAIFRGFILTNEIRKLFKKTGKYVENGKLDLMLYEFEAIIRYLEPDPLADLLKGQFDYHILEPVTQSQN